MAIILQKQAVPTRLQIVLHESLGHSLFVVFWEGLEDLTFEEEAHFEEVVREILF